MVFYLYLLALVISKFSVCDLENKSRNTKITVEDEVEEIKKLKKSFLDNTWNIKYPYVAPKIMANNIIQCCQDAYKSYLQDLIMKRLYSLNKITYDSLQDQLNNTDHKCKLCIAAMKISSDDKFLQKHGNKFIYKVNK